MDNLNDWERGVARDHLPYEEALVRLYELRDRYDCATAAQVAGSAAAKHYETYGHRLRFGCCSDEALTLGWYEQQGRALLDDAQRELYGRVIKKP